MGDRLESQNLLRWLQDQPLAHFALCLYPTPLSCRRLPLSWELLFLPHFPCGDHTDLKKKKQKTFFPIGVQLTHHKSHHVKHFQLYNSLALITLCKSHYHLNLEHFCFDRLSPENECKGRNLMKIKAPGVPEAFTVW